jgi:CubicO group peptidase (beta-lactamase class C family)
MAGTLLAMAMDQGLVGPDAEAAAYFPPLRGRPMRRPLLVRHLYTHTSGLWGHWGSEAHDLEERVADYAPCLPIGHKYDYNGTGLELGGKILEAVTGESLPQIYRRCLLEPLGMVHTEVTDSGGGARSTALDMAKFGQMLLNGGAYGDRLFFREEAFRAFLPHRLVKEIGPETETVYGFGCSWYEAEGLGEGTFGHGAASSAIFRVSPEHRLVVVMCRNTAGENYGVYSEKFMEAVAAAVAGE